MSYSTLIAELSTSVDQGIFTGKKSAINHEEMHYGPENKRACPCDTCPLYEACAEDGTECSAMRNWCSKGDYKDKDIQRLLRAAQAVDKPLRLWQYNSVGDSAYPPKLRKKY